VEYPKMKVRIEVKKINPNSFATPAKWIIFWSSPFIVEYVKNPKNNIPIK
jgi:hypothetical protein